MNELRWILIGFGIVLLAGIYLWGRRGSPAGGADDAPARVRPEPALHGHSLDASEASLDEPFDFDEEPPPASTAADLGEPRFFAARPGFAPSSPAPHDAGAAPRTKTPQHDVRRGRQEPTMEESAPTAELPVRSEAGASAPTLSSSEAPQPRRLERRKILSLRLAASPSHLDGAKLLGVLQEESMQHGRYDVFHRLHDDGVSIFSVASMVEPGTFDLETMAQTQYSGVTLFAQLPGPVPGMHALNELVACARKLQQALGGTLQDDRGVPLTVHRIERLRQEVRDFERPTASGGSRGSPHSLTS